MTVGQITFEAYMVSVQGIDSIFARRAWGLLKEKEREAWEAVGQAVYAFYETGIPGAK
jgi:hypothetical protein